MSDGRHGLVVREPAGWNTRVFRRSPEQEGEVTHAVLHACTRALPADRGDLGGGVPSLLGSRDVFVSLVEFGDDVAGQGLFAPVGMPKLAPSQFSPNRLQQVIAGRSAAQHFFTEAGRAFCLFVILGSHSRRMALVPLAQHLLAGIEVSARVDPQLPRRK